MSTDIEENQTQQTDTETAGESASSENFRKAQEGLYGIEDDAEEDGDVEDDDLEAGGAPEQYEDFNLPERFERDEANAEIFSEFCRENDWTQDQAQKASDFYHERLTAHQEEIRDAQKNLLDSWVREARTDKEIGGGDMDQKLSAAKGLIDKFSPLAMDDRGNPIPVLDNNGKQTGRQWTEFGLALAQSGMGNHPAAIRFAYRLSQALGEDFNYVQSGGAPSIEKTAAETLYGNYHKK